MRGRFNYTNLSRYSDLNEKTYRHQFGKKLNFIDFNRIGNSEVTASLTTQIDEMDCSFVGKSGDKTYGLGQFWDSKQGKAEKGLEISTLAVVDVDYKYGLSRFHAPNTAGIKGKRNVSQQLCAVFSERFSCSAKKCTLHSDRCFILATY